MKSLETSYKFASVKTQALLGTDTPMLYPYNLMADLKTYIPTGNIDPRKQHKV